MKKEKIGQSALINLQEEIKREIRNQFVKMGYLSDSNKEKKICLCLSGGVNSTILGLVAHHLKLNVVAVSFYREGYESSDLNQAQITCKKMGWEHHIVKLPKSDNPKEIFMSMIKDYQCERKTEVEILYPMTRVFKKVKSLGFDKVVIGHNSTPDNRKSSEKIRDDNQSYWNQFVEQKGNLSFASSRMYVVGLRKFGVRIVGPMLGKKYNQIFLDRNLKYKDLKKTSQKSFLKDCFPEDFEMIGMMKTRHKSLQKGGGIEDFFAPIIYDKEINHKNYKTNDVTKCLIALVNYYSKENTKGTNVLLSEPISRSERNLQEHSKYVLKYEPYSIEDVKKESKKELFTVVSLFAGGGGSSTGYRLGGGRVLLINEFVPEAVKTYSTNFPDTPIDGNDIRKITRSGRGEKGVQDWFKKYGINDYDILDGSPPCSTFSIAGKGEEKNDKEDVKYSDVTQSRIGYLIHEWVYIANCTQPKVCVLENVPEIQTSGVFKNALIRLRRNYKCHVRTLSSNHFGVPQKRRRTILIGVRKDICEKLNIQDEEELLNIFPKESSYENTISDAFEGLDINLEEEEFLLESCRKSVAYEVISKIQFDPPYVYRLNFTNNKFQNMYFNTNRASWHKPCSTLTQTGNQSDGLGGIYHPSKNRKFTIDEMKRIFSLPDDFKLTGTFDQRAERICRMVPPFMIKHISQSIHEKVLKKLR